MNMDDIDRLEAADAFFLPEVVGSDVSFAPPQRTGIKIDITVDGYDTFAAMELSAAQAKSFVFLATWMFGHSGDPGVSLMAPSAVARALGARRISARPTTWVELLGALAKNGVDVRVILTDFDAVEAPGNHEGAWRAHAMLFAESRRVEQVVHTRRLHVITSRHSATIETLSPLHTIDDELRPKLTKQVLRIAALAPADRQIALRRRPGMWPFIDVSAKFVPTVKSDPPWVIHPASHHQKILVIDAAVAYCGGLDLAATRADTPRHDSVARRWHDVQCRVDGPVAHDLARAFAGRWNGERENFDAFVTAITTAHPRIGLPTQVPTQPVTLPPSVATGAGAASAQLLRTVSVPASLSAVPKVIRDDVRRSYENAIGRARKYIYLENQYVRDSRIAEWILDRASMTEADQLVVIVVVPVAPEEASPSAIDPVTEQGMALQKNVLDQLQLADSLRGRFGVYSMVAKAAARGRRMTDSPVPPPGYRSRQIYVHSKLLIVDDIFAIVGSANADPRSFTVDTEACVAFHDPNIVRNFRLTLWRELLGNPADLPVWTPDSFVTKWTAIAEANRAAASPSKRQGFVVPHDRERFPGTSHFWLPDAFTGLTEQEEPELA